jgi:hypothetical protein
MIASVWSQGAPFAENGHIIADIVVGVWLTAGASEWVSRTYMYPQHLTAVAYTPHAEKKRLRFL